MTVNKLNSQLKSNKPKNTEDEESKATGDVDEFGDSQRMEQTKTNSNDEEELINLKRMAEIRQRYVVELQQTLQQKALEAKELATQLEEFV
jgi:ribosome-binding protein aMBF1 (putative translation factor)